MRLSLALTLPALTLPALTLLVLPSALSAQIAPRSTGTVPPLPVRVRIEPPSAADYEMQRSRDAIRAGRESGALTKSEARALRREARQNAELARRYGRDGLSPSEQRELEMRGRALSSVTEAQRTRPPRR